MPELLPLIKIAEGYLEACEEMGVDAEELVKLGQQPTSAQMAKLMETGPVSPARLQRIQQKRRAGAAAQEKRLFGPGFGKTPLTTLTPPAALPLQQARRQKLYGSWQPGEQARYLKEKRRALGIGKRPKPAVTPVAPPGGVVRPGTLAAIRKAGPAAQRQFLAWMRQQPPEEQKRLWGEYQKLTPAHLGSAYARKRRKAQQAGTWAAPAVTGAPAAPSAAAPGIAKLTPEQLRKGVAPTTSAGLTPEQLLARQEGFRQERARWQGKEAPDPYAHQIAREAYEELARLEKEYPSGGWLERAVRRIKTEAGIPIARLKERWKGITRGVKSREQLVAEDRARAEAAQAEALAATDAAKAETAAGKGRELAETERRLVEETRGITPEAVRREADIAAGRRPRPLARTAKERISELESLKEWDWAIKQLMIPADKGDPVLTAKRLNLPLHPFYERYEWARKYGRPRGRGGYLGDMRRPVTNILRLRRVRGEPPGMISYI